MAQFRIRTRLVGPEALEHECRIGETYLGPNGVQSPPEKAIQFRSHKAAERALMEAWNQLRNAGNKSVILSVVASR